MASSIISFTCSGIVLSLQSTEKKGFTGGKPDGIQMDKKHFT